MPDKDNMTETPRDPAANAMASLAELQKAGMGSMVWLGKAMAEGMSGLGSEVLKFVAARITEDVKTQHEILHCKDVAQLQHFQARFLQKAIDQYTAETGKLVQLSNELVSAALVKKTD